MLGNLSGTTIIPVKIRLNNGFEFTPDVALGPFAGAKMRISHYKPNYLSLGFTTGISIAGISPLNSKQDSMANIVPFTIFLGLVAEFDRAQIGVFIVTDHINGNKYRDGTDQINWDHQGKPWISIGLGYSILSRPTKREMVSDKGNGNE